VRGKGACGLNTMVTAVTAAASTKMLDAPAVFV
jgi:hypothetical protein